MKEKTVTKSFKWSVNRLSELYALINFDPQSDKSFSDAMNDFLNSLLLTNQKPDTSNNHKTFTNKNFLDPSLPKETLEARKALQKKLTQPLPPPPCHYASKGYIDPKTNIQIVYCDNPRRNKGKPLAIPLSVCQQCWNRRQFVKEHKPQIPKQVKQIYCINEGMWVFPSKCQRCTTKCERFQLLTQKKEV